MKEIDGAAIAGQRPNIAETLEAVTAEWFEAEAHSDALAAKVKELAAKLEAIDKLKRPLSPTVEEVVSPPEPKRKDLTNATP